MTNGIIIAGTHSGCGKTTLTLGILAALKREGLKVQPFKAGPDFIDPGLHRVVADRASRNLDLWMCGRDYVIECFHKHSMNADISVIEGVMGLYDGSPCTAALANTLNLPIILVVDAYGMAESAGAVVKGFLEYKREEYRGKNTEHRTQSTDKDNNKENNKEEDSLGSVPCVVSSEIKGVIFNRVASSRHYARLRSSVEDVAVLGYLPRNLDFNIPHRHLGLVVAEENPLDLKKIDKLANVVLEHIDVKAIIQNTGGRAQNTEPRTQTAEYRGKNTEHRQRSSKVRIGIAYDKAFCFYYEDNLDLLREAGAEIVTFSPLSDSEIPDDVDILYVGGGYPELYAKELSDNKAMLESIKNFSNRGMPVYAECGGFMYLTEGIFDFNNQIYPMVGVFPFKTKMTKGGAKLGYREVILKQDSILGSKGSAIAGHEFHYSEIKPLSPGLIYTVRDSSGKSIQDEGYRVKNTLGSYIHIHFGSNKSIAKSFIKF